MTYSFATWLAPVLRASGVRVVEHSGWQARGLPGGSFAPSAVVWHHDASPPGDSPGVPAYLIRNFSSHGAHAWVDRQGVWHLIGAGRAAHAGETLPGKPTNSTSFGIETDHTVGEAWPPALLSSLRIGTAAILRRLGTGAMGLHFHSSICSPPGRKIDPAGLTLATERAVVARLLVPAVPARPTATAPYPGRPFGIGSRGAHVASIQRALRVDTSGGGLGVFGPKTLAAVKTFQRRRPWLWPADGTVGPKTYRAIVGR